MVLRVGLFGCGRVAGFFHAPILSRLPDVVVTALVDESAEARIRMAGVLPGATLYADWRRPIELGEIDAAVICLPPALHAPVALAAMQRGIHVYVEKPVALDLVQADAMIAAQAASDRLGLVGFNFRFHPSYRALRERLGAGEFGAIRGVRTLFTSAARSLPGWKSAPGAGGDAITDLAMHHLDLIPFLTERAFAPASVTGQSTAGPSGSLASILATLEDGVPVSMTVGQTTGQSRHKVELLCEAGHVSVDPADPLGVRVDAPLGRFASLKRGRTALQGLAPKVLLARAPDPSFERALKHFVEAVRRGDTTAEPGFDAGRRALALAGAALRSGKPTLAREAAE